MIIFGWAARAWVVTAGLAMLAAAAAGCGTSPHAGPGAPSRTRMIYVVAAENFWGSIAGQLGGSHVTVLSLVSDPNADPHEFESSAASARAMAKANFVIQNGAGYDDWVSLLAGASPNPHRRVLSIGALLGKHPGDNPHLWYDPGYVTAAENRIEACYKALDPRDAAYFTARRAATDAAFAGVRARLAEIRRQDAGKPIASTESIVVYLARYLGLRVISPPAFMNAVSQGNEPPAASVAQFERQLATHQADVLVYNEQTATAVTTSMRELAIRYHIPVVGITETIQPPRASFQRWFGAELAALRHALSGSAR
ncbi:MAG TPA: zinc ABC transporter substrate-binding protein [Streptosporangiaceae bacterium]|nr:zinc ABC transporter substrate-binding protein [Streptosporangiaceae bacterium]